MAQQTRIQLCGRLVVEVPGGQVQDRLPGRQGRVLFGYLAAHRREHARDGVPVHAEGGLRVTTIHRVDGHVDRPAGDRDVRGSLEVGGHVAPGALRVEGAVDRADLRAGAELVIVARAGGASLHGGSLQTLRRRLHRPPADAAERIDGLVALVGQLQAAAAARGRALPVAVALAARRADRRADLAPGLARASALLAESAGDWPVLRPGLADRVVAACQAIEQPEVVADPLTTLCEAAGFLAAAVPARRPGADLGMRVSIAHSCAIVASGDQRLTGAGASECDITAAGDLVAPGCGWRSTTRGPARTCCGPTSFRPASTSWSAVRCCGSTVGAPVCGCAGPAAAWCSSPTDVSPAPMRVTAA